MRAALSLSEFATFRRIAETFRLFLLFPLTARRFRCTLLEGNTWEAIGTTRALLQGVEFEKWTGVVTDGKDDAGDGGNPGGGSDGDQGENPLG